MAHLEHTESAQLKSVPLDPKVVTYIAGDGQQLKTSIEPAPGALAALYRAKRHFVLIVIGQQPVLVNQCKVTLFNIIREGDALAIGPCMAVFRELTTESLPEDSELASSGRRCLVCGRPFKPGAKVVYCPSCRFPHHEPCWQFQRGRCANGTVCDYQAPFDEPANPA